MSDDNLDKFMRGRSDDSGEDITVFLPDTPVFYREFQHENGEFYDIFDIQNVHDASDQWVHKNLNDLRDWVSEGYQFRQKVKVYERCSLDQFEETLPAHQ